MIKMTILLKMEQNFKINDDDIFNYLMTSDFNDGYTLEESKFLLTKFRQFYRILNSKNEQLNHSLSNKEKELSNLSKKSDIEIKKLEDSSNVLKNTLNMLKNRKLSIFERINGKIKIENDTK